jgi:Domain of unknown function (DUF4956)
MFDISTLATNGDNTSAILIFFSVLMAFCLSSLLVFVFEKTSREVVRPDQFLQTMILMSIITASIMQCIGDSPTRGFGIFGALSILRLRLDVSNTRSVTFLFASVAVGIGCGVYSFLTVTIGTVFFSLIVFLLYKSPFSQTQNLRGRLRLEVPQNSPNLAQFHGLLTTFCQRSVLKDCQMFFKDDKKEMIGYDYQIKLKNEEQWLVFCTELGKLQEAKNVRLDFNNANEKESN